jgi:hypothetical protein
VIGKGGEDSEIEIRGGGISGVVCNISYWNIVYALPRSQINARMLPVRHKWINT